LTAGAVAGTRGEERKNQRIVSVRMMTIEVGLDHMGGGATSGVEVLGDSLPSGM
jgi:hypothetical protein